MDHYSMERAAKKLIELRDCRTRAGVARALGIGASRLQTYEEGRRKCPDEMQDKIAEYYGVRKEDIFLPPDNA